MYYSSLDTIVTYVMIYIYRIKKTRLLHSNLANHGKSISILWKCMESRGMTCVKLKHERAFWMTMMTMGSPSCDKDQPRST